MSGVRRAILKSSFDELGRQEARHGFIERPEKAENLSIWKNRAMERDFTAKGNSGDHQCSRADDDEMWLLSRRLRTIMSERVTMFVFWVQGWRHV